MEAPLLCLLLFCSPGPELGPERPHAMARECAESDAACVRRHDDAVLDQAFLSGDIWCERASDPDACRDGLEGLRKKVRDEVRPPPAPAPVDPCLWVGRIDEGVATLLDTSTGDVVRVQARAGWRVHARVGSCPSTVVAAAGSVR